MVVPGKRSLLILISAFFIFFESKSSAEFCFNIFRKSTLAVKSEVVERFSNNPYQLWLELTERYEERLRTHPKDPLNFSVEKEYKDFLERRIATLNRELPYFDKNGLADSAKYVRALLKEFEQIRAAKIPYRRLVVATYHFNYAMALRFPKSHRPYFGKTSLNQRTFFNLGPAAELLPLSQILELDARRLYDAFETGDLESMRLPLFAYSFNSRLTGFIGKSEAVAFTIPRFLILIDETLDLDPFLVSGGTLLYAMGVAEGDKTEDDSVLSAAMHGEHDLVHGLGTAVFDVEKMMVATKGDLEKVKEIARVYATFAQELSRDAGLISDTWLREAVKITLFIALHEEPGYFPTNLLDHSLKRWIPDRMSLRKFGVLKWSWNPMSQPLLTKARMWIKDYLSKSKSFEAAMGAGGPNLSVQSDPSLFHDFK